MTIAAQRRGNGRNQHVNEVTKCLLKNEEGNGYKNQMKKGRKQIAKQKTLLFTRSVVSDSL